MGNNTTAISPDITLNDLLDTATHPGCQPEHMLSQVSTALSVASIFDDDRRNLMLHCIQEHYDAMHAYARSSTVIVVKKTASKCATLLGHIDDTLALYSELLMHGDTESLFDGIDVLVQSGDRTRAKEFMIQSFQRWIAIQTAPIQEIHKEFLSSLAMYAFDLGADDLGHHIVRVLEGREVEGDDPTILRYKRDVTTPEEYALAMPEIGDFYLSGQSENVSPELLASVWDYLDNQLGYIDTHRAVDPLVREHDEQELGGSEYGFDTPDGVRFYALQLLIIRACFYADAVSAEIILQVIEDDPTDIGLIADILESFPLTATTESLPDDTRGYVYDGLFITLLREFQGVEYRELHERIYALMQKLQPIASQEIIGQMKARQMKKEFFLQKYGIWAEYFGILSELSEQSHPLVYRRIMDLAMNKIVPDTNQTKGILCVYYILQSTIIHGMPPMMGPEFWTGLNQSGPLTHNSIQLLEKLYPKETKK